MTNIELDSLNFFKRQTLLSITNYSIKGSHQNPNVTIVLDFVLFRQSK